MNIKRFKRLLFRIWYYPSMASLKVVSMINEPLYKRCSYKLLKQAGIQFTGIPNFISNDVYLDAFDKISIGADCVISKHVTFLTHDYSFTTGLRSIGKSSDSDLQIQDSIKLGNNVFVGLGTILLPGTSIGDNCIIGAGSVVKGAIPSGSVVAGNPAKILCNIEEFTKKKIANMSKYEVRNQYGQRVCQL